MTLLLMSVSHCTTPLNFDMPEFTVTMPELSLIHPTTLPSVGLLSYVSPLFI